MARTVFSLGGISRSLDQLMTGFSIAMTLLLVSFGAAVLLLLRGDGLPRDVAWLGFVLSATCLVVAVVFLPTPPIITMTVAVVAFGLSLRGSRLANG